MEKRQTLPVGGDSVGSLHSSCNDRAYAHLADINASFDNKRCSVQSFQLQLLNFYSLLLVASNLFPSFPTSKYSTVSMETYFSIEIPKTHFIWKIKIVRLIHSNLGCDPDFVFYELIFI